MIMICKTRGYEVFEILVVSMSFPNTTKYTYIEDIFANHIGNHTPL